MTKRHFFPGGIPKTLDFSFLKDYITGLIFEKTVSERKGWKNGISG